MIECNGCNQMFERDTMIEERFNILLCRPCDDILQHEKMYADPDEVEDLIDDLGMVGPGPFADGWVLTPEDD